MSLSNVLSELATIQGTITGIKRAYDLPPRTISQYPSFVNMPDRFAFGRRPTQQITDHAIKMMLFIGPWKNVPNAINNVLPFVERVRDKFNKEMTINSGVTYSEVSGGEFMILRWGSDEFNGIVFDIIASEWGAETYEL